MTVISNTAKVKYKWILLLLTRPVDTYFNILDFKVCFFFFFFCAYFQNWFTSGKQAVKREPPKSSLTCRGWVLPAVSLCCTGLLLFAAWNRHHAEVRLDLDRSAEFASDGESWEETSPPRCCFSIPYYDLDAGAALNNTPSSAEQPTGCRGGSFLATLRAEQCVKASHGKIYVRLWVSVQNRTHPVYSLKGETTLPDQQAWHAGQLTSNPPPIPPESQADPCSPVLQLLWGCQGHSWHSSTVLCWATRASTHQHHPLAKEIGVKLNGLHGSECWCVCVWNLFVVNILNPELLFSLGE